MFDIFDEEECCSCCRLRISAHAVRSCVRNPSRPKQLGTHPSDDDGQHPGAGLLLCPNSIDKLKSRLSSGFELRLVFFFLVSHEAKTCAIKLYFGQQQNSWTMSFLIEPKCRNTIVKDWNSANVNDHFVHKFREEIWASSKGLNIERSDKKEFRKKDSS